MDNPHLIPAIALLGVLAVICVSSELGFRLGRRGNKDDAFKSQLGVIRNATFAMMAFLIGFSFSGAATRYIDRLDMVVREANAIGTAYLRADVLAEPHRSDLKEVLRQYAADRLELLHAYGKASIDTLLAKVPVSQNRMWDIAMQGVKDDPRLMRTVLPPLNDVIDLHSTHLSAARRHTPEAILMALIGCAALAFGLVGYTNGVAGRRFPVLTGVYGAVVIVSLWMTIDLDRPRHGFIRVSEQPFVDLVASMKPVVPPVTRSFPRNENAISNVSQP